MQKEKKDSQNSWSIDTKILSQSNGFDLSVKNPNKKDEKVLRNPKEILEEIANLDKTTEKTLSDIKKLI